MANKHNQVFVIGSATVNFFHVVLLLSSLYLRMGFSLKLSLNLSISIIVLPKNGNIPHGGHFALVVICFFLL